MIIDTCFLSANILVGVVPISDLNQLLSQVRPSDDYYLQRFTALLLSIRHTIVHLRSLYSVPFSIQLPADTAECLLMKVLAN